MPISVDHIESESKLHIEFVNQLTIGFEPESLTLSVPPNVGANLTGDADTIIVDIMSVIGPIAPNVDMDMLPDTHIGGKHHQDNTNIVLDHYIPQVFL